MCHKGFDPIFAANHLTSRLVNIQVESESRLCNDVTPCCRNSQYKLLRSRPRKLSYSRPVSRLNYYLGSFTSYVLTVNPSSYLDPSH